MKEGHYYYPDEGVPETPEVSDDLAPWGETRIVGRALPRVDGYERVSGAAVYPSDVRLSGMLHAAILRCPHGHAEVRSVDVSAAEGMPGVRAVVHDGSEGADIPWYRDGDGNTVARLFDPHCRFAGEAVAAVAADTPYQARDALAAIAVEYEVLPHVLDAEAALEEGSHPVREGGNRAGGDSYERGDVAAGFAAADVVLEESYSTACELHTPLELHGCVARWEGPRLTVWESSQGVYAVQSRVARALDLPLSNVRVIGHYVGGGFGSKLATGKFSVIAALLARRTGRAVKLFLSREETMLCVGNRPANTMRLKAGVKKDGTLTALEFEGVGSGGAYSSSGTGILDWQVRDLYRCENVRTRTTDAYINAGEERPMRAPGHPQCSWALEQMLDALAEEIGIDPVELRLANLTDVSQGRGGVPYTSTGFGECLERGAEEFGWKEARAASRGHADWVRGVGMGGCVWIAGAGGPPSTVIVKYFADGSVNLNMGASDIGTGTKTVMAMIVAEELPVELDRIQIENADTGTTQYATPSGGSKTVPTEGPAVRAAAIDCRRQLVAMAAEELEVDVSELELAGDRVVVVGDPERSVRLNEIETFRRRRREVIGVGYRGPNPEGKVTCPFAAQFCEVAVNLRTGEVEVLRFLGAHDSGRVMSRKSYDSQVYGGIVMGIGFGMTERRVMDRHRGRVINRSWHDYKIPTAKDVPVDMVSLPVEVDDDECNAIGAKGLGEPVTIPTAAAVANAVYHATGVRVTSTPINPTELLELIAAARGDGESPDDERST